MATDDELQAAMTEWVRAKVQALREEGLSFQLIGKQFGVSKTLPQSFLNPKKYGQKGVGQELEGKIAKKWFGGSRDRFRAAALQAAGLEPGVMVVADSAAAVYGAPPADEGEDEIVRAKRLFPELAALKRYPDEHCLAALMLYQVDRWPRLVAQSVVKANPHKAFDEKLAPDLGLRAAHIAQTAREWSARRPGETLKGAKDL